MSPVAAERASADSAPAEEPPDGAPPEAEPDGDWAGAEDPPAGGGELEELLEDPQPLIRTPAISAPAIAGFWMESMPASVARRSDYLLNGCLAHQREAAILADTMYPSLLIVEDDSSLRDVLVRSLQAEGFAPRAVATARELLDRALTDPPDVLVIDVGLPDADGRDLCQALRAQGVHAPVLFLTARDALTDRLSGFSAGGDDYLTKPFDVQELAARLHALLKRSGVQAPPADEHLVLNPAEHTVSRAGCSQPLTPTEFRLLAALAARPGRSITRRDLIRTAWPHGAAVQDNTLDVYIARIRRKLAALEDAPTIGTVHGVGYRLQ